MPAKERFTVATGAILKERGTTKNFIEQKKVLKKHTGTPNEH